MHQCAVVVERAAETVGLVPDEGRVADLDIAQHPEDRAAAAAFHLIFEELAVSNHQRTFVQCDCTAVIEALSDRLVLDEAAVLDGQVTAP